MQEVNEQSLSEADTIKLSDDDVSIHSVAEPMYHTEDGCFYENILYVRDAGTQTEWNFDFLDIDITDQDIQNLLDLLGLTMEDFSVHDNITVINVYIIKFEQ